MEKSSDVVDVFHQKETDIDKEKLNYFLSELSVWEHFGIEKNIYESFADEKKQAMLFEYYNELHKRYYVTGKMFFCLFFLFYIFLGCLVPDNFNVRATNLVGIFMTKSTPLSTKVFCLKNEPSKFAAADKKRSN